MSVSVFSALRRASCTAWRETPKLSAISERERSSSTRRRIISPCFSVRSGP